MLQNIAGDQAPICGLQIGAVQHAAGAFRKGQIGDVIKRYARKFLLDNGIKMGLAGGLEFCAGHGAERIANAADGSASVDNSYFQGTLPRLFYCPADVASAGARSILH